ncbi:MAG: cob(I)yrinic acid a,c-diamide adenosyltransferase [Bacteroidales bacterium]|nr:cob(I)yrinic acid a,c-diamide adenosyltransferase [Bacteroidales bacterium]MCF8391186.1 cob(I)yrinic acid a,c-diamide adenosyltransferase [Bacteroidales bacterium]
MKIYTKTGDTGSTSLIGGKRVPKYHERIEVYGSLDELISFIGLLRDSLESEEYQNILISIQDRLMVCSSILASESDEYLEGLPKIFNEDIELLEIEIDRMEADLEPLTAFILPGGHQAVSLCHIARTICRRVERQTVKLAEQVALDEIVIKYLNRLSDYFFVLSRKISKDFNAKEIPWKPKL